MHAPALYIKVHAATFIYIYIYCNLHCIQYSAEYTSCMCTYVYSMLKYTSVAGDLCDNIQA